MPRRPGVALVIGISRYRDRQVRPLPYAFRDARAVARAFEKPEIGNLETVHCLLNKQATRAELITRLSSWLPEQARGKELAVLYFAGHGLTRQASGGNEGYLLPHDGDPQNLPAHAVSMADLGRWIQAIEARAVVVFLDCCHSGKATANPPESTLRNVGMRLPAKSDWPALLPTLGGQGQFLIASCAEDQFSLECPKLRHGLFTYYLLRGLGGEALDESARAVTVSRLFDYVTEKVAEHAHREFQQPQVPWKSALGAGVVCLATPRTGEPAEVGTTVQEAVVETLRRAEADWHTLDEDALVALLRRLRQKPSAEAIPVVLRCLTHRSERVPRWAQAVISKLTWPTVAEHAVEVARRREAGKLDLILKGLKAYKAHQAVVDLLDQMARHLQDDLRRMVWELRTDKILSLGLERTAEVFARRDGRLTLKQVLGSGVFVANYLAHDEGRRKDVVVRALRDEYVDIPAVRDGFRDLCVRAAQLVHHNLAHTVEVWEFPKERLFYTVRDYIEGTTLKVLNSQGKRFEPRQVLTILQQLAGALMPTFDRGWCHGGVKPSNIFIGAKDRVILGDPALPATLCPIRDERVTYDCRYVAPETLEGEEPGPVADLYSLGCVIYELLCGRPPFVASTAYALGRLHNKERPRPPSADGVLITPSFEALLLRLLARDPSDRPRDLEALLAELHRLGEDRHWAVLTAPPGGGEDDEECLTTAVTSPPPVQPLLREQSLARYQDQQSVMSFAPGQAVELTGRAEGVDLVAQLQSAGTMPPAPAVPPPPPPSLPSVLAPPAAPPTESGEPAGPPSKPPVATIFPTGEAVARLTLPAALEGSETRPQRFGRYLVLGKLGQGGMGAVYLADDPELCRKVAIKIPSLVMASDSEILARFRREARVMAQLTHPNVCPIYEVGVIGEVPYFVMPFIEGVTLSQRLRETGVSVREALTMVRQLALVLDEVHRHGIVHRDLKPGNIMIRPRGDLVLMDLGLAAITHDDGSQRLTSAGGLLGTPAYMAPERVEASGSRDNPASDIYALGVMLYEMLTGQLPFSTRSVALLVSQVLQGEIPPPSSVRPELGRGFDAICQRAMAREPRQRFATMGAFAKAIDQVLARNGAALRLGPPNRPTAVAEPMTLDSGEFAPLAPKPAWAWRWLILAVAAAGGLAWLLQAWMAK